MSLPPASASLATSSPACAAARIHALLPCAGSGSRAAGAEAAALPKQYRQVAGRPLVLHTLAAFAAVPRVAGTLVAVAPEDGFFTPAMTQGAHFSVARCGGATRAETVLNGLAELRQRGVAEEDWVLVHDAARCLVTPAQIEALIAACEDDPVGGLLALKLPDTLKAEAPGAEAGRVAATLERADKWLAQTPQMFRLGLLRRALLSAGTAVTDESSAVEALGLKPRLVSGSAQNFKVTYPEDFALADAVLTARAGAKDAP